VDPAEPGARRSQLGPPRIRRLREELARTHAAELIGLGADLTWHAWTTEHLLAPRSEKWSRSLVALDADGRPLGYAVVSAREGGAHLHQIVVGAGWRGAGIGRALVGQLIEESRRDGLARVTLKVRADNARAINFYERIGFVRIDRETASDDVMALELTREPTR
jgi:ribosomal-protein-alanine N-acetyltransferase